MQALIYALGLERMLQARANTPLGSALTSELRTRDDDAAGAAERVESSWVAVELENASGSVLSTQRFVRHPRVGANLVRVWREPVLTAGPAGSPEDTFLHAPGSASREHGFHRVLADFLGWDLPNVATFTGSTITLYSDVIFPFLIVDQQSWGSAAPRKVDRFQIREPLRRSAEFLLGLAGPEAETQRSELEQKMALLRTRWAAARSAIDALAGTIGGRVVGLPEHAAGSQARTTAPQPTSVSYGHVQVLVESEWLPIESQIASIADQLRAVESRGERPIPPGVDVQTRERVVSARSELADVVAASRLIESDLSMEEAQLAALDRRISMLNEERDRNRDIRTLANLGSQIAAHHLSDHNCPTCRQSLDAVEAADLGPVLDVDETVSLLNAQITTAQKMRDRSQHAVAQASSTLAAMQRHADQVQTTVRALESDLLAPANAVSAGDIAQRVTLELRLSELHRTYSALQSRLEELGNTAVDIAEVRRALSDLPIGIPDADERRLAELTEGMRARLRATRFGSYDVSDVTLDQDSLRPTRAGFDVDTDASASDVVRVKVAYLDAVRVIGQTVGRHPGVLVLDEPRQQDIDPQDYAAMLHYLAASNIDGGQVLVTSATPRGELDALVSTITAHVTDLGDERLLRRDVDADPLDIA